MGLFKGRGDNVYYYQGRKYSYTNDEFRAFIQLAMYLAEFTLEDIDRVIHAIDYLLDSHSPEQVLKRVNQLLYND